MRYLQILCFTVILCKTVFSQTIQTAEIQFHQWNSRTDFLSEWKSWTPKEVTVKINIPDNTVKVAVSSFQPLINIITNVSSPTYWKDSQGEFILFTGKDSSGRAVGFRMYTNNYYIIWEDTRGALGFTY